MTDKPTVVEALSAVMGSVQGVRKADRNEQQRFMFRGIDAVMNAVGPALRTHGVVVVPLAEEMTSETYETSKGTQMRNVTIRIRWRFYGPAGDFIEAVSIGEAADSGDKAVSKAHSVAYRTVLLQALCIPTDEPDPDASSHERAVTQQPELTLRYNAPGGVLPASSHERAVTQQPADPTVAVKRRIMMLGDRLGYDLDTIKADFAEKHGGDIGKAGLDDLTAYARVLDGQVAELDEAPAPSARESLPRGAVGVNEVTGEVVYPQSMGDEARDLLDVTKAGKGKAGSKKAERGPLDPERDVWAAAPAGGVA